VSALRSDICFMFFCFSVSGPLSCCMYGRTLVHVVLYTGMINHNAVVVPFICVRLEQRLWRVSKEYYVQLIDRAS
jgi:hypothetical protein